MYDQNLSFIGGRYQFYNAKYQKYWKTDARIVLAATVLVISALQYSSQYLSYHQVQLPGHKPLTHQMQELDYTRSFRISSDVQHRIASYYHGLCHRNISGIDVPLWDEAMDKVRDGWQRKGCVRFKMQWRLSACVRCNCVGVSFKMTSHSLNGLYRCHFSQWEHCPHYVSADINLLVMANNFFISFL